jgi:hypothetical protein
MSARRSAGIIMNAAELTADEVVGQRVLCPGCEYKVFEDWPNGWDAHAASRCWGVTGSTAEDRKLAFKLRFRHLFR